MVVGKLHCVHERIRFGLNGVGEVGIGEEEVGIRYLAPHFPGLEDNIGVTEGRKPEALLNAQLSLIDGEHAAHEPFWCIGVGEGENRSVEVDRYSVALGLIEFFTRGIAQSDIEHRLAIAVIHIAITVDEREHLSSLLNVVLKAELK